MILKRIHSIFGQTQITYQADGTFFQNWLQLQSRCSHFGNILSQYAPVIYQTRDYLRDPYVSGIVTDSQVLGPTSPKNYLPKQNKHLQATR